jgi:hypothetical protein
MRYLVVLLGLCMLCACPPPPPPKVAPPVDPGDMDRLSRGVVRIYGIGGMQVVQNKYAIPIAGHGSGVVYSADCMVLTNHHVVGKAITLGAKFENGTKVYPAVLVAASEKEDIAVLVIDRPSCPDWIDVFGRMERQLKRGTTLSILGFPLDPSVRAASLVTGIVSRYVDREGGGGQLIQTTAPVNPGNSGGPSFTQDGRFTGLVVAKSARGEGMGFVIPAGTVEAMVRGSVAAESIQRARAQMRGEDWSANRTLIEVGVQIIEARKKTLTDVLFYAKDREKAKLAKLAASRSSLSPDVLVMLAGVTWNAGVVMIEKYATTKFEAHRAEGMKLVGTAAELIVGAARRKPALAVNPFVMGLKALYSRIADQLAAAEAAAAASQPTPAPADPSQATPQKPPTIEDR